MFDKPLAKGIYRNQKLFFSPLQAGFPEGRIGQPFDGNGVKLRPRPRLGAHAARVR
jgi:hypothetical protein